MHPDPSRRLNPLETYNYILDYMKTITTKKKGEIKKIISSVTKNAVNIKKKLTAQIKYDHALSQKISIFKENH